MGSNVSVSVALCIGFSFLLLSCNTDNRRSFSTALEYNDYIIGELNALDDVFADISNSSDENKALGLCNKLKSMSEDALNKLNIQPFEDDSSLCVAANDFVRFYIKVSENDGPEFFKLAFKENLSVEQNEKMNALSKSIDSEYRKHIQVLKTIQKQFAKRHNQTVDPE